MFLTKENNKESFWLSLCVQILTHIRFQISAKFWTHVNPLQNLDPYQLMPKIYWPTRNFAWAKKFIDPHHPQAQASMWSM